METDAVERRIKTRRTAMIALMVCANIATWHGITVAEDAETSASPEASTRLKLTARPGGTEAESSRGRSSVTSNGFLSSSISLGLIAVAMVAAGHWIKRHGIGAAHSLPADAFELLGKRTIDQRNSVHLVRCGSRVLVLAVGPEGMRTLSEVDDPIEVERLTDACQRRTATGPAGPTAVAEAQSANARNRVRSTLVARAARIFPGLFAVAIVVMNASPLLAQSSRRGDAASARMKDEPRVKDEAAVGAAGRQNAVRPAAFQPEKFGPIEAEQFLSPQQMGFSLKMLALMTVISVVPSILLMTTCFVRFTVVLGLLRQALGTQQGPPNQVMSAICLFMTILVMSPVWQRSYQEGIRPYTNPSLDEPAVDEATAISKTLFPIRSFMSQQIEKSGNSGIVWMLHDFQNQGHSAKSTKSGVPESYDEISFAVLTPAYLLSELKVGFLIGFQLFLPFLVIDLVITVILTSLGMTMLPPSMVSLPFKLLLFVLIDGWFLTVGMLLESVKVA